VREFAATRQSDLLETMRRLAEDQVSFVGSATASCS